MSEIERLEFLESVKPNRAKSRLSPGSLALLAAVLISAALLGAQLARQNRGRPRQGPAPDFTLKQVDGGEFKLSDYRGQVVLINFWASWCPPCRAEAPDLNALYADFNDAGFTIIGVNMLESSRAKALAFIDEYKIAYPNGEDYSQHVTRLYRVEGPPESFLIDKRGHVRDFIIGAVKYDTISGRVQKLLAEPA